MVSHWEDHVEKRPTGGTTSKKMKPLPPPRSSKSGRFSVPWETLGQLVSSVCVFRAWARA